MSCFLFLRSFLVAVFVVVLLCGDALAKDGPVEYVKCASEERVGVDVAGMTSVKIFVTTKKRDMSNMDMIDIASAAYSAMEYYNSGEYMDAALVNVLLTPSCDDTSFALARAQVGRGSRIVTASSKSHGPDALMICVASAVAKAKKGKARMTNRSDYESAAKLCRVSPDKAKEAHLNLAEYAMHSDWYDMVSGTPPRPPKKR